MELASFALPILATVALGSAMFMPLRDDRLGRRATVGGGSTPLRPDFRAIGGSDAGSEVPCADANRPDDVVVPDADSDIGSDSSSASTRVRELERRCDESSKSSLALPDLDSPSTDTRDGTRTDDGGASGDHFEVGATCKGDGASAVRMQGTSLDETLGGDHLRTAKPIEMKAAANGPPACAPFDAQRGETEASELVEERSHRVKRTGWRALFTFLPTAHRKLGDSDPSPGVEPAASPEASGALASAWRAFAALVVPGSERSAERAEIDRWTRDEPLVVERSFAAEIFSLLSPAVPTSDASDGEHDDESSPMFETPQGPASLADRPEVASLTHRNGERGHEPEIERFEIDSKRGLDVLSESDLARDNANERARSAGSESGREGGALPNVLSGGESERTAHLEAPVPTEIRDIHSSAPSRYERIVPLTRLPLRRRPAAIDWTIGLAIDDPQNAAHRHEILERAARDATSPLSRQTLESAFDQEDVAGRLLAIRALQRRFASDARATFVSALRSGSDEERFVAVTGLIDGGSLDALPAALDDRVDAIAAHAALAFVGSSDRRAYRERLAPYVDAARIDVLLTFLGGVLS